MERIGLYGGSFNPVHLGHLLVAQAAREEWSLDRLFFIPAALSPFKPGTEPAPPEERSRWLRLALAGETACEVDMQELNRGGISYSIDTVRSYRERYPGTSLFYLIGADHLPTLPKWRDAEKLARLVTFLVIPRPGTAPAQLPEPYRLATLQGFPLGLSSSQVRERIAAGRSIRHLVPPAVAEALSHSGVYSRK